MLIKTFISSFLLILSIIMTVLSQGSRVAGYALFVTFGMAFALVGDIVLAANAPLREKLKRPFEIGMALFAMTHILYAVGMLHALAQFELATAPVISIYFVMIVVVLVFIARFCKNGGWAERILLAVYGLILSLPLSLAGGLLAYSYLPLCGMALFFLSDGLIAIDRCHKPIPHAGLWVWLTYVPAQLLVILGFLPFFLV